MTKPAVAVRCAKRDPKRDFECVYSEDHTGRCCMQRRADIVAGEYVTWLQAWRSDADEGHADG